MRCKTPMSPPCSIIARDARMSVMKPFVQPTSCSLVAQFWSSRYRVDCDPCAMRVFHGSLVICSKRIVDDRNELKKWQAIAIQKCCFVVVPSMALSGRASDIPTIACWCSRARVSWRVSTNLPRSLSARKHDLYQNPLYKKITCGRLCFTGNYLCELRISQ